MISQFKRYSPFSKQIISTKFDSDPQFGKTVDLTVPRHGDLITNMYLDFGFTPPGTSTGITYGFVPSIHMFDKIELIVGDVVVETLYPEFINIYYNVFTEFTKKKGNIINLGPIHYNSDVAAQLPDNSESILYNTRRNYTMMLPFYFSMKSYQAFPLCALTRQELVVRLHIRELQYIVQSSGTYQNTEDLNSVEFTHMSMNIEYVYLSNDEFSYFLNNSLYYMYTETQEQKHEIVKFVFNEAEEEDEAVVFNKIFLDFKGPIVELYLYILHNNKLQTNRVDKHEEYNETDGHSISSINIQLDGNDYVHESVADSLFLSQIQYLLHHSSVFENNDETNNMYVYNYSFSDSPEECCPSGTVNFGLIKNKILNVNLPSVTTQVEKTLFILARSLNIIKIENGTLEVLFKNIG